MNTVVFVGIAIVMLLACLWILVKPLVFQHRRIALLIVLFLPLTSASLYAFYGNFSSLAIVSDNQSTVATLERTLADAKKRLQTQPQNIQLLLGIARGEHILQNYDQARIHYQKILQVQGDNPYILLAIADILTIQNTGIVPMSAQTLLEKAYAIDSSLVEVLWLLAIAAQQQEHIEKALGYWQELYSVSEQTQPQLALQAQYHITQLQSPLQLHLTLTLADAVDYQPSPTHVLFISVHTQGESMPIAAYKQNNFVFPYRHILTDADSLLPNRLLSSAQQFEIRAKVRISGTQKQSDQDLTAKTIRINPLYTIDKAPYAIPQGTHQPTTMFVELQLQ